MIGGKILRASVGLLLSIHKGIDWLGMGLRFWGP